MELETTGGDRSSEVWEKAGIPDDLRPLNPELISQGAEARVYKATFLGRPTIVKERFTKAYRLPELDVKLNQSRITQEARCLVKGRAAGVCTPAVFFVDHPTKRLYIEYIEGQAVKHFLFARGTQSPEALELGAKIGQALGRLHNAGVIHGDLTTSNMMVKEDGSLVMIDFGLSYVSRNHVEDAAVDLYVLERAFTSTHPSSQELFACIIEEYRKSANKSKTVLPRLEEVRLRGRKKIAFG